MHPDEKEAIIDELSTIKRKAHKLEITLHFKGKSDEAAKVKKKSSALAKKIDGLIANIMESWIGSSKTAISSLKKTSKDIQDAIRDIKKDVESAEKIVKALRNLDEAIKKAASFLI